MPNIYEIDNDKVVGFEKEAQTIINQLIRGSKEREVVLITDMGGLGKTSLVKRVYDEKIVANHFHTRVWCTVSQEYDCKDLLNKIYNQVCGKETEIDSVAEKLRKSLMGWRYLIVLDDIWSLKAWEELNRAFPSCDNGSRVVLTSRQESVVSDAKHICLPFFTVDESWELLQVKLFQGKGCPKELENIGKEISKKCGGLPLVVGLVAGLLGGVEKSKQMWQEVLNTLSSHVAFRGGIKSNDAIELSYNHLPDHLKPCLLYFAAIPEDKTIAALKLINLWISEGFIDIKEKERVEDTAGDFLNHLVGSNLVMVSNRKYDGHILSCGVHDLVRDFCLTKAKDENFLHIIKMEKVLDPTLKLTAHRISFHRCSGHHEIPNELVPWNSSIRTLLGFESSDICGERRHIYKSSWVAKRFEHLTILDLEFIQVDISIMFEVNSLIHLRYLALKLCGSGSISPWLLENLQCLITLKLTSGGDAHLPKLFWNMRSLRNMVIHHYCSKSCPMEGASTMETTPSDLEVLQTLNLNVSLCIRDEHLLRKLPHLKNLRCAVSKSYPFAEIDFLRHLESLELSGTGRCKPHLLNDLKLTKFPSNIKEIHFSMLTLSSSAISIIAQLSKLEALTLKHCVFEDLEWNVDEETQFRKLKFLQLFFPHIRIWNVSSAAESFPCLEQLILEGCFMLEGLSYSFADISTLELISVVNCPNVDSSVKKIQEDVQSMGSEQLTFDIGK
ncbi:putative late blight resistance protein homolog R1A-10 [Ipomoea triloba]|uniref:putative late blight resistance protein homolog R1A-10 n=1 Tax=Ipomoea triloba TaxID=35885 RepID=UPI00125DCCDE|nr:putative late blight resistance protein homolog R1A-10 [Ipomoea triloba]